jgi:hypothetical protein
VSGLSRDAFSQTRAVLWKKPGMFPSSTGQCNALHYGASYTIAFFVLSEVLKSYASECRCPMSITYY